jgi:NAD+ kinase
MSSRAGSTPQLAEAVRRVAVVTHGKPETIGPALERLRRLADERGIELQLSAEEAEKHGLSEPTVEDSNADLAVVLGGDGTMLRALQRFLGSSVAVVGVNFGSVGFLTSIPAAELESGLARVFAGEYRVFELPTLEAEIGSARRSAVNDVVAKNAVIGRMVELGWAVGEEYLGTVACDGIICSAPSGSTAYNLSNGGPVMVWGLDAMAVTFIAPHSLHARPLVVPRGLELVVWNRTPDVPATVLTDGHSLADLELDASVRIRLAEQRSLLATLPESTFFKRYREIFAA